MRRSLASHEVATAFEMGWSQLENGELLAAAEGKFDAFITTDQNLRYQQNLQGRRLAILALPTTNWLEIQKHLDRSCRSGQFLAARRVPRFALVELKLLSTSFRVLRVSLVPFVLNTLVRPPNQ